MHTQTHQLSGLFQRLRSRGTPSISERCFRDLLDPLVSLDTVDQIGRELDRMLRDSSQSVDAQRQAAYYLAQIHEFRDEWGQMVEMLELSGVAPGRDYDNYDWRTHRLWAEDHRRKQDDAIARGVPAIYVNSLPHSGSSFFNAVVTSAFGIDRCRTTKGPYMSARIVPAWLTAFARGGATTHEHFNATPENISVLEASGIAELFVHVRHPVAAMLSGFRRYQNSRGDDYDIDFLLRRLRLDVTSADLRDQNSGLFHFAKIFLRYFVEFMESWKRYAQQPHPNIKVRFSRYEDQIREPSIFYRRAFASFVGDSHNIDLERIVGKLQSEAVTQGSHNYHGRRSNSMIDALDEKTREVVASLVKSDMLEFYGYETTAAAG